MSVRVSQPTSHRYNRFRNVLFEVVSQQFDSGVIAGLRSSRLLPVTNVPRLACGELAAEATSLVRAGHVRPVLTETDLELGHGRRLHVYDSGDGRDARLTVFWHHGTPNLGPPPEPPMRWASGSSRSWAIPVGAPSPSGLG